MRFMQIWAFVLVFLENHVSWFFIYKNWKSKYQVFHFQKIRIRFLILHSAFYGNFNFIHKMQHYSGKCEFSFQLLKIIYRIFICKKNLKNKYHIFHFQKSIIRFLHFSSEFSGNFDFWNHYPILVNANFHVNFSKITKHLILTI
jgi:hypothetical protein